MNPCTNFSLLHHGKCTCHYKVVTFTVRMWPAPGTCAPHLGQALSSCPSVPIPWVCQRSCGHWSSTQGLVRKHFSGQRSWVRILSLLSVQYKLGSSWLPSNIKREWTTTKTCTYSVYPSLSPVLYVLQAASFCLYLLVAKSMCLNPCACLMWRQGLCTY